MKQVTEAYFVQCLASMEFAMGLVMGVIIIKIKLIVMTSGVAILWPETTPILDCSILICFLWT